MSNEAMIFYKRLASLLSEKWKEPYTSVLGWLGVVYCFACFNQLYNVSEGPGLLKAITSSELWWT